VNIMKRKLFIFISIFIFYFFYSVNQVKAQFWVQTDTGMMGAAVPGVSCGVPVPPPINGVFEDPPNIFGEGNGTSRDCCPAAKEECSSKPFGGLPGWATNGIPLLNDVLKNYSQTCDSIKKMQSESGQGNPNDYKCVWGKSDEKTIPGQCICVDDNLETPLPILKKMCERYIKSAELQACVYCASGQHVDGRPKTFDRGFWTALGCIPLDIKPFIEEFVLKWGIGLAGMIALLCIIYSAIMIQTSAGNAEKIKKAQQNLTSCIIGLILIIFSVFILKLIGVDILRIPL